MAEKISMFFSLTRHKISTTKKTMKRSSMKRSLSLPLPVTATRVTRRRLDDFDLSAFESKSVEVVVPEVEPEHVEPIVPVIFEGSEATVFEGSEASEGSDGEISDTASEASEHSEASIHEHMFDSDHEEFNNLDDFFEITDEDRVSVRAPDYDLRSGAMSGHWHGVLALQVQRACASECYRRRTMSKLMTRFTENHGLTLEFQRFMGRTLARLEGEELSDWQARIRKEKPFSYLKLCVVYDIYVHFGLRLDDLLTVAALDEELDRVQRVYMGSVHRLIESHVDQAEEHELNADWAVDPDAADLAADKVLKINRELSCFLEQRYIPRLYRFRLFDQIDEEYALVSEKVKLTMRAIGLPLHSPVGKTLFELLCPDYLRCPIRGPFRAGYIGSSSSPSLYGASPNPMLYYCDCRVTGAYCGHLPVGLLLRDSHPVYRIRMY